jgi:hypothetical protein
MVQLWRPLKDFYIRETISLPLSCPPLLPLSHCVHPALLSSRWRPAKQEFVFLKGTASGDLYEKLMQGHGSPLMLRLHMNQMYHENMQK